jgi:hypothetical protein
MRGKATLAAIALACVAAAAVLALAAGTARADAGGNHFTFGYSGVDTYPAGTMCDFNEQDTFTVDGQGIFVPNTGWNPVHLTVYVTHTNLDTGYFLTEVDHYQSLGVINSGQGMAAGLFWHLRDPSGNLVLVRAGQLTFDTTGITGFTPNSGADQTTAQILCPALGGSPA